MKLPRLRVRTYMLLVGVVAVLAWAAPMGLRSYEYYRRAGWDPLESTCRHASLSIL